MGQILIPAPHLGLAELQYGDFILNLGNKRVPSNFSFFVFFFLLNFMLFFYKPSIATKSCHVNNVHSVLYVTCTPLQGT